MAVGTDLSLKERVVVQSGGGKGSGAEQGTWVQCTRFQTSVRLSVPSTFVSDDSTRWISRCSFPGSATTRTPLSRTPPASQGAASSAPPSGLTLDLFPAYWDANNRD
ncbi:hypothetical protein OH76DRAFT_1484484 [Lentinus brumalis]|uniref:Uncharacterized protein n=1 Tax=Lentinus brumalis TaxID=2498619 RepID=A0A371D5J2_9APHY|nr:hypothetical protein OH76DRAFT_1484484 [Polyporus brumalis]